MKRVFAACYVLTCIVFFVSAGAVFAAPTSADCPRKVLETKTIEGIYQGADCGDSCYVFLKLDNGEDFSAYADPDEVEKIFGTTPGKRVSVTYSVEQTWYYDNVEETNPNGPGQCGKGDFFKSGKVLK